MFRKRSLSLFSNLTRIIFLGLLVLLLNACKEKPVSIITPIPSVPNPEVIITAYPSFVIGEIMNIDGCIRVHDKETDISYAILWTPDVSATIEGDKVKITTGIVRKNIEEVTIRFGDTARVSGGETAFPDEQLLKKLPSSCQGPFWVIGFEIEPIKATE